MLEAAGQLVVNILTNDLVAHNLPWLIILGCVVYFFFSWRKEVRETRSKEAEERRSDQILSMQRIRLTETNLKTKHQLELLDAGVAAPMASFNLTLSNIGDGPIDILCALMCGRMLDLRFRPGIGTHGRNVEWDDHRPYYWNDRDSTGLFTGLSTTKSMIAAPDQYLRLAPGAKGVLRRKDAVRPVQSAHANKTISLKYQGFVVARGYPLGEIWRQLGGRPPDLIESLDLARLQFRAIARPDLHRWRCVQEALFNLNRLVFRLALEGSALAKGGNTAGVDQNILAAQHATPDADAAAKQAAEAEGVQLAQDPLGLLMTPDAWRLFLLHHMEFVDLRDHPGDENDPAREAVKGSADLQDVTTLMERLTQDIKKQYLPNLIVPDDFATNSAYIDARATCYRQLKHVVDSWSRLTQVIAHCRDFRIISASSGSATGRPAERGTAAVDGYVHLIKTDPAHQNLWLAYLREGYLVSKPFPRKGKSNDFYDAEDIPEDPRDLEPYVMLTLSLDTTMPQV
jgi:hypothetical protein